MRLRPSAGRAARLAAVLAGSLALGLVATTGTASAATPTVIQVSDAQLATYPAAGEKGANRELSAGGTATVIDSGAKSYLQLKTPDALSHATVHTYSMYGKKLDALTDLSFQSLIETVSSNGDQLAPSLNIEINPNKAGKTYTTLVWEPINAHIPVQAHQWQTFTPSTTPAPGGWWATKALSDTGTPNIYGFNTYTATFADVQAALPDATIISVGVNQGTGSPALVSDVDQLKVNDTVYDFDNPVVPNKVVSTAGSGQSARALTPFASPLQVKVTGRDGTVPAPGAPVTFTVATGGNADYPGATFPGGAKTATVNADASGVATSPQLIAGLIPGPVTVTATSGSLPPVTFTLTVTPPAGAPVADLAVTVTGVPLTAAPGSTFVATVSVRNTSSFPTTQVRTVVTAPAGLRITGGPTGIITPAAAVFTAPTLAPGATLTYPVTFTIDPTTHGLRTLTIATSSTVRDPAGLNNVSRPTLTVQ